MKRFPLKRMLATGSLCLAMLLPTPVSAYQGMITSENVTYSPTGAFYQKQEVEKIANGVEHIKISKLTAAGWVDIHVLKAQMQTPGVALKTLRSNTWQKKETLKEMADKSNVPVLGAVNASYFGMSGNFSESQGFEFDRGLVHFDNLLRPGLFEDISGKLFFSHTQKLNLLDAETGEDLGIMLKTANAIPGAEGAAIYNNKVVADSKSIDETGEYYKVSVRDGVITEVVRPYTTASFTEEGYTLVFSANMTSYPEKLTVGRKVQIKTDSGIALDWLKLAMPGGGYILRNGQLVAEGELVQPGKRHPRTALGVNAAQDTLYMMVVDGRGSSIGATHSELAEYLREMGVTDAVAMDGGGSSVLLARNLGEHFTNIENTLPNNHQRKLINGLAVVSTLESGEATQLIVTAQKKKTFANMPMKLEVRAIDANHMPVAVDMNQVVWSVGGVNGNVQQGLFTATSAGKAEISAYLGKVSGRVMVEVTENPIDLQAIPSVLEVSGGESKGFKLLGTDAKGFVGEIAAGDATYRLEDETVGYFADGLFVPSKKGGSSRVTITVGNRSTVAYIVGGKIEKEMPELLTAEAEHRLEGKGEASVKGEKNFGYHDLNSLSFAYFFPAQGQEEEADSAAKQVLEMRYKSPQTISGEIDHISLVAYGNENVLKITMDIQDEQQKVHRLSIANGELWDGWKEIDLKMPGDISYPIRILGFTIENLEKTQNQAGQIYLDDIRYLEKSSLQVVNYVELPEDPLRKGFSGKADLTVFGATGGRNRILDSVILQKAIAEVQQSASGLYAGLTDLPEGTLRQTDRSWKNAYEVYDAKKTRVIHLATKNGSFKNADGQQFARLSADLSNTVVDNIVVVSDVHPLEEVKNKREAAVIHEILSRYAQSSGKNLYYVAASGYQTDVTLKDGVRYIKTNGLWYHIKDGREIDLNKKFYTVNFYLEGNTLYYDIKNLFPLVE